MLNFLEFLSVISSLSQCSGVSNWTVSGEKKRGKLVCVLKVASVCVLKIQNKVEKWRV